MTDHASWTAHPHLAWALWGLDEIEATLASLHGHGHKHGEVDTAAHSALTKMQSARDIFRKTLEEHDKASVTAIAPSRAILEKQWGAFEESLHMYLDTVGKQVTEQEGIFRARADAQSKAWRRAIDNLHKSVMSIAADRRGDLDAAVKCLESEAEASKLKLDALNKAENASWIVMQSALSETRAALERTHQAVLDTLAKRA